MGVGVGVGVGLGVGVGVGDGVGAGDGDAGTVAVGEGAGTGESTSSADDGTPHPASPAQTAMASTADAGLTIVFWRRDIGVAGRPAPAWNDRKETE
ncbi:hypothetical protein [Actinomyces naeslundii]